MLIFTELRSSAFDICDALELLSPQHVRAVPFVGLGVCAKGIYGRGRELSGDVVVNKFMVRARVSEAQLQCCCRQANSTYLCRRVLTKRILMSARCICLCITGWRCALTCLTSRDVLQVSATGPTQRIGRVKQEKRARVVVLCMEGSEERSWKSQYSQQSVRARD